MDDASKDYAIVCIAVVAIIATMFGSIVLYSGMYPPFSVVNSGSMQHSMDESRIGVIDTGDIVIVQSVDKHGVTSYVDGLKNNYSQFGEYGDVIIYRDGDRNIIHRAMIHLTLVSCSSFEQIWNIPSLIGYDDWDILRSNVSIKNTGSWNENNGDLTLYTTNPMEQFIFVLKNVGYSGAECKINLWNLGMSKEAGYEGFLTKGDNSNTNPGFDQSVGITKTLVGYDRIKSVAVSEIPWLGCAKLLITNKNVNQIPSNSITDLAISLVSFIIIIIIMSYLLERWINNRHPYDEDSLDDESIKEESND